MEKEETIKLDQESGVARDQSGNLSETRESSLVYFLVSRYQFSMLPPLESIVISMPARVSRKRVAAEQLQTRERFSYSLSHLRSSQALNSALSLSELSVSFPLLIKLLRFKKVVNDMN